MDAITRSVPTPNNPHHNDHGYNDVRFITIHRMCNATIVISELSVSQTTSSTERSGHSLNRVCRQRVDRPLIRKIHRLQSQDTGRAFVTVNSVPSQNGAAMRPALCLLQRTRWPRSPFRADLAPLSLRLGHRILPFC